jgi:hypothetical protein
VISIFATYMTDWLHQLLKIKKDGWKCGHHLKRVRLVNKKLFYQSGTPILYMIAMLHA